MSAPHGFKRVPGGWLEGTPTPERKQIAKMKQENTVLKSQLDAQVAALTDLAAKVEELAAGKKGKK